VAKFMKSSWLLFGRRSLSSWKVPWWSQVVLSDVDHFSCDSLDFLDTSPNQGFPNDVGFADIHWQHPDCRESIPKTATPL
jgi:hypothetical protein